MLEAEAKVQREEALKHLVVGTAIVGTVRSVVPFGAFVDVGGIEGLVPLAEMSHNRGDSPGDVFHVNQEVEVHFQRIDAKGKIWLSRKAVLPDPWAEVAKKYAEGTRHKGRVARLQPFGAFIELESGIDGLIHTSDLSKTRERRSAVRSESKNRKTSSKSMTRSKCSSRASIRRIIASRFIPLPRVMRPVKFRNALSSTRSSKWRSSSDRERVGSFVRVLGATGRAARGFHHVGRLPAHRKARSFESSFRSAKSSMAE